MDKNSFFDHRVERMSMERRYYSFRLLHKNRSARIVAYWLIALFLVFLVVMMLPWQQNVQADGFVTTLLPGERPQKVNSAIGGIIRRWYVREGQQVKAGDTLIVIGEIKDKYFDPELLLRTQEQVKAQQGSNDGMSGKVEALATQIEALQQSLVLKRRQAENKVVQTRAKMQSDSVNYVVARDQYKRYEELLAKGLISLTDFEKRKIKYQETENYYLVARQELANAQLALTAVQADYMDKISKAQSDRSESLAKLNEGQGKLSKIRNELTNMEIRAGYYVIRAPQDGIVVQTLKAGLGETIKDGEAVCTIMPLNYHPAVELFVSATDVPLLSPGRKVRLEFDGWPALQFSGWPSVSVGTFGGEIAVVDMVNSKGGKYRVLVKPDPAEQPWPAQLRIGSGVYGWAMLDRVRVWFEIWRQLNGFPPSLQRPTDEKGAKADTK